HCFNGTFSMMSCPLVVWVEELPLPELFGLTEATSNAGGVWPDMPLAKTAKLTATVAREISASTLRSMSSLSTIDSTGHRATRLRADCEASYTCVLGETGNT